MVYRLGMAPYRQAWTLQDRLARQITAGEHPPALLLLEHPHVYTFGRRGQADNLLWGAEELKQHGVTVEWVDRGGDVTYHGPGQLVGYPLLPLAPGGLYAAQPGILSQEGSDATVAHPASAVSADTGGVSIKTSGAAHLPGADYVGYLRRLEAVLILALSRLGVNARRIEGLTGVWLAVEDLPAGARLLQRLSPGAAAKIAAIGVKVDASGVSRHGFALNLDTDPVYWQGIVGCGLKDTVMADLVDILETPPSIDQMMDLVTAAFGEVFGYQMETRSMHGPEYDPPMA